MVIGSGVASRFWRYWAVVHGDVRIRDGSGLALAVDGNGSADVPEHRDMGDERRVGDPHGFPSNAPLRRGSLWERLDPTDALCGVAIVGLLFYALVRGMDNTVAFMLNSFFAMLIGRMTVSRNGNGH